MYIRRKKWYNEVIHRRNEKEVHNLGINKTGDFFIHRLIHFSTDFFKSPQDRQRGQK